MYPDSNYAHPLGSFQQPLNPVDFDVEPDATPLQYCRVNVQWLAALRGAAKQLLLQSTWDTDDPATIDVMQQRAFNLIDLLAGFDCPPSVCIPDWEPYNPTGTPELLVAQRGQGLNGAFYVYCVADTVINIKFRDTTTHADVGGLINHFHVINNSTSACAVGITDCLDVFNSDGIFFGDHDILQEVYGSSSHEIKSITIGCDEIVTVAIVMKNNWTCGNL